MSEQEEFEFRLRLEQEQAPALSAEQRAYAEQGRQTAAQGGLRLGPEPRNPMAGGGEIAAALGSSALLAPLSGLAGLAGMALPGPNGQGGDWARGVQGMAYQPRTLEGQVGTEIVTAGPVALSKLADLIGEKVSEGPNLGPLGRPMSGSPLMGALVNAGIQAGPVALGVRGRAGPTTAGTAASEAARIEPFMSGGQPNVFRSGRAPDVPLGVPSVPLSEIGQRLQTAPQAPVESALRLEKARSLPVPIKLTKGQATRDPTTLRQEEILAQTPEGRAIQDRHIEQNRAIIENLDRLQQRPGARAKTPEDVGRSLAGEREVSGKTITEGALAMAERKSAQRVSELYKKADASPERNMPVTPQPMIDWLTDNGAAAASVPEINSIAQMLKKFGAVEFDENGGAIAKRDLTIGEMENIRKLAVKLQSPGTPSGHFMGDLKRVIDWTTQDSGGDLYKAARNSRRAHAMEFEEPKAIASLLDSKTRTDRAVALEDVWGNSVLRGSIADIERVRSTLLNAKDRTTRDAGRQAWRDVAGQTVDYIKTEATKSVALDAAGNEVVSPAALKRAIDRIGDRKLDIILGKSSADTLRQIAQVTQDTKTLPPNKVGSTTVPNFLAMMNKFGSEPNITNFLGMTAQTPGLGALSKGVAAGVTKLRETGLRRNQVSEALNYHGNKPSPIAAAGLSLRDIARDPRIPLTITPSLGLRPPPEE